MEHKTMLLKAFAAVVDRMDSEGFTPFVMVGVNETGGILLVPLPNKNGVPLSIEIVEDILIINLLNANRTETEHIKVNNKPFGVNEN